MDILMHHYIKKFFNEFVGEYPVLFFIAVIIIIVVIGTIAFHIVEGWNLFNSFYFTTVTMSTIGYGDMAPLTHGGKVIAIIYGFMGAPLFIGLTGLLFQTRFQKLIKHSIHAYHREAKEAEVLALQNEHMLQKEEKEIEEIHEEVGA
ncbi:MAG: potassium channel family protein [Candidatus Absconditabacterales bacterium]